MILANSVNRSVEEESLTNFKNTKTERIIKKFKNQIQSIENIVNGNEHHIKPSGIKVYELPIHRVIPEKSGFTAR